MPDEIRTPETTEPILQINTPENEKKSSSKIYVLAMILIIIFVGFLFFYKYRIAAQVTDKEKVFDNLQTELSSKKNQQIENQIKDINSATAILSSAEKTKYLFRVFIDDLKSKITNDSKLDNLSIDQNGKMTISGQSKNYRAVADLAEALGSSTKLKNVNILSLSQSAESSESTVNFSISAEISDWKSNQDASENSSGGANE